MGYDEGLAERIRGILDERQGVSEKRMFGGIAFMIGGHMCVGIVKDDLMVRVGRDAHERLVRQPHARPMDFTGRPMKGFLYVASMGLEKAGAIDRSLATKFPPPAKSSSRSPVSVGFGRPIEEGKPMSNGEAAFLPTILLRGCRRLLPAAAFLLACLPAWAHSEECGSISAKDAQAVRAVVETYRAAWLRGDADGVLATLTEDAVLLPAHGAQPVIGVAAIKEYWWPPNAPATTVTKLDITTEGVGGDCRLAYVHGHDDVWWTVTEDGAAKTYGHPGTYLNILRKLPDGSWRISHHMWDDGTP